MLAPGPAVPTHLGRYPAGDQAGAAGQRATRSARLQKTLVLNMQRCARPTYHSYNSLDKILEVVAVALPMPPDAPHKRLPWPRQRRCTRPLPNTHGKTTMHLHVCKQEKEHTAIPLSVMYLSFKNAIQPSLTQTDGTMGLRGPSPPHLHGCCQLRWRHPLAVDGARTPPTRKGDAVEQLNRQHSPAGCTHICTHIACPRSIAYGTCWLLHMA